MALRRSCKVAPSSAMEDHISKRRRTLPRELQTGGTMSSDSKDPAPGTGAGGFSPQDAMEFMQRMWNPFGVPMPGFGMGGAGRPPGPPGRRVLNSHRPFP